MFKKLGIILGYFFLFIFSFVFFVYLTFPYQMLAERLAGEATKAGDYRLEITDFDISYFSKFTFSGIKIYHKQGDGSPLEIKQLQVNISMMKLLMGKVGASVDVKIKRGNVHGEVIAGINFAPKRNDLPVTVEDVEISFNKFPVDPVAEFFLQSLKNSMASNQAVGLLIAPMINNLFITARLSGKLKMKPDFREMRKSQGSFSFKFNNAEIDLGNPDLKIPKQVFSKADISGKVDKGNLKLSDSSKLVSNEINITPTGKVMLNQALERSLLDLVMQIKLSGALKNNLQILLTSILGLTESRDGSIKLELSGTLASPRVK